MSSNNVAKAEFKITNGREEAFSEGTAGARLTSGKYNMVYSGEMEAESVLMELKNYSDKNTATIYGLERITGSIHHKKGSFVLEHIGKFENGIIRSRRTVVPGSANGALEGLRGEINFYSGASHEFSVVLKYHFE